MKQKCREKVYAFDLIDNDVLQYNIVPALFSFLFKDLMCCLLFRLRSRIDYPILPIQTCVWPFQIYSKK